MTIIGMIILAGGIWILQDTIASILWYLGKDDEKWHYNHAVRCFRGLWGITNIVIGILILLNMV